ncbi:MAG: ABC transporter ATP-binding protein [Desulfitobacteriaceae bacterium]|nr:ABC transporter ATP-binding protein [Desulfitobacteriaceae bacterium]MDI6879843.1 ABC transporter ATP-binding protein [Desulfitobacteriaceae bacterium]MDI6915293.1 ABC transporter ATP-binding protein [Desulfitobacteriaceae bacterium]
MAGAEAIPRLKTEKLTLAFQGKPVLKGIDLTVRAGEFLGLIGPNGAGKTTLLKCLNGIYPSQGKIWLQGVDLKNLTEKEIAVRIGVMHQNVQVTFPFPAGEVVLMGRYPHLKRLQRESGQDYRIARESMEYTDTLQFAQRPISELSGGERQRVLFAKVLAQEPEIILLDEPTASLDIRHQEQIFQYAGVLAAQGKTVIAAVHDLKIAARYCTRLVLLKDGEILADGVPEGVLTSENVSEAYGVRALVYRNAMTGLMDVYLPVPKQAAKRIRLHVIGGGGSGSDIMRSLVEHGYEVSAGVLSEEDSDFKCAQFFGIDCVSAPPFSGISEAVLEHNVRKIQKAQLTVLGNIYFGESNLRNLEAALQAPRLILVEDDFPQARDFTNGKALALYRTLRKRARVTTSAGLITTVEEVLAQGDRVDGEKEADAAEVFGSERAVLLQA